MTRHPTNSPRTGFPAPGYIATPGHAPGMAAKAAHDARQ